MRDRSLRAALWAAALAGAAVAAGCGGGRAYPVEGKVVFADGQPAAELAGGSVVFESAEANVSATGEIGPDGSFRLTTYKDHDGAPAGKYKVVVTAGDPEEVGADDRPARRKAKRTLDPRFQSLDTTPLEVTVEPRANRVTLKVERAK